MTRSQKFHHTIFALLAIATSFGQVSLFSQTTDATTTAGREHLLMDFGWKFALGNANDSKLDFNFGAYASYLAKQNYKDQPVFGLSFDDSKWRTVDLPHDWGMELPFNQNAEAKWGARPLGVAFPETSVGWYRKTFTLPASDKGRRISIEFEGVCHDCVVEVNGFFVGTHFSGYTSFGYDITDLLHYGGQNVVVVRVDARTNEGWWYQGAGIYRHVWLTKTAPVHIAQWGTQVLTKTDGNLAHVTVHAEVANDSNEGKEAEVQSSILDDAGQVVATTPTASVPVEPWSKSTASSVVDISNPKLWSTEAPTLYRAVTTVKVGSSETDRYETTFGIRTVAFDPDKGFLLNGQPLRIRGFCDHEQHVIVGTAMPDSLWPWQLNKLKTELGANAIRTSHNAPSPALLDACDRLGILVMDEERLFSSSEEGLNQLDSLVRRDRNHPSVIIWSAGNEEWAVQSTPDSIPVMERLQEEFHRLDPSRLVTCAASNAGDLNGLNRVVDVRGINYLFLFKKDSPLVYHQKQPHQPVIGTEDGDQDGPINFMRDNPWYSGFFVWTGYAYYGESKWPDVVANFGCLDLCGFPRGQYDRFQKAWGGTSSRDVTSQAKPASLNLSCERTILSADGEDTAIINIAVVDDHQLRVGNATNPISVVVNGPGTLLGIGNGNPKDHNLTIESSHAVFEGRAQVLVRATHQSGTISVQVTSAGLKGSSVALTTQSGNSMPYVP